MKRVRAPKFWKVERKVDKFTVTPKPGPHSKDECIPLAVLLRDILKYAENMKEVKEILKKGIVKTNGCVRKAYNYPAGLMDLIEIGDKCFRIIPTKKGLGLVKTKEKLRLVRVDGKTVVRKNKIQLNLHDGTNLLQPVSEGKNQINTGDVLVIEDENVKGIIKLKKGTVVIIIKGKNQGEVGYLEKIEMIHSSKPNKAHIKIGGKKVETLADYIFAVGKDKPIIEVHENG
jgi:small subunit ribosomal protein S4e